MNRYISRCIVSIVILTSCYTSAFAGQQLNTAALPAPPSDLVLRGLVAEKAAYDRGFMPTGSTAQRAYMDRIANRLMHSSCLTGVTTAPFSFTDWRAGAVGLVRVDSAGHTLPLKVAGPIAYSGTTGSVPIQASVFALPDPTASGTTVLLDGVAIGTAIANYPVAGQLVLVKLPLAVVDNDAAEAQSFYVNDPDDTIPQYGSALWLTGVAAVPQIEAALKSAGALGMIAVVPSNDPLATRMYAPLNGVVIGLPGVYLAANEGAALKQALEAGTVASAKLELDASINAAATMNNLIATLPGASTRTLVISSHTDGSNAVEDNGPIAMQALISQFCAMPQDQRPLTLEFVFDGGHFAGNAGLKSYVQQNGARLQQTAIAALEIEHIAALEVQPDANGRLVRTGLPETTIITLSTLSEPPVDQAIAFSEGVPRSVVAPRKVLNFGAGGPLTSVTDVIQVIVGPQYLLGYHPPDDWIVREDIDYAAMQGQIGALAQLIINLGNTPPEAFAILVPDPTLPAIAAPAGDD